MASYIMNSYSLLIRASVVAQLVKNLTAMQKIQVQSLDQEDSLETTPVFMSGKPCVQKNLAGYSPWGCKESDVT